MVDGEVEAPDSDDSSPAAPPAVRAALLEAAPEAVRGRVADLVSQAVGQIPAADLPAPVRPVARFAPAKRAKVGAGPMLAALGTAEGFADEVVAWWREHRPDEWAPPVAEPVHAAAVAVLTGDEDAARELLRDAGERADVGKLRAERDAALARADKLAADLERVTAERDEARAASKVVTPDLSDEVAKLRSRLREQGVRVRKAEDAAAEAAARLRDDRGDLQREVEDLRRERTRDQEAVAAADARARRATAELESARRAAHEARHADDARLALLVDTVAGAASGLRHELGLRADDHRVGPRPAELVGSSARAPMARVTDPATLDRLLALPEVHLLVDGYNVTKTGWPSLSLAAQRDRLVASVAPLAARTHAETTLVFDGAGITGVPTASVRGVRVLFSEAGVIADDLIRLLVDAEPEGRPLVVVTSDRAVVDSVRRRGAHPVPSSVLLDRLARI
ncbi:NYN domain-containing protein [Actinomycetospora endophytica]|uniref:NYN domain-containing protein n=1 Tax=Actinomycetospora endophytica TaxID=2291215 RepID=A0ABS8PDZ9_9PSEU|nr:NYN domain-containing protein [Actinomycetospora endophytica]MCD2196499.1 NYN domain-containing protein [Actinomycetospora endophytica]